MKVYKFVDQIESTEKNTIILHAKQTWIVLIKKIKQGLQQLPIRGCQVYNCATIIYPIIWWLLRRN